MVGDWCEHVRNNGGPVPYVHDRVLGRAFKGLLQGSVLGLVAGHGGLESSALLPQLGNLRPQHRVLALQECSSHRDLVLL